MKRWIKTAVIGVGTYEDSRRPDLKGYTNIAFSVVADGGSEMLLLIKGDDDVVTTFLQEPGITDYGEEIDRTPLIQPLAVRNAIISTSINLGVNNLIPEETDIFS